MSSRFSLRRNRRQPPKESRKNYSKDPKFYDDSSFTVSIALITSACKRITTRQPIIVRKLGRSNEKNEQAIQLPQYLKEFDDDINKLLDASENIRKHFGLDRTNETQPKTSFDRKTQDRASTGQLGEGRSRTGQGQWGSESKPFQREYGSTGRQEPGSPDVDVVDQSSERGSRENRGQATERRELQKDHTSTETFERLRKQYEQMKSRNEELEDKFQNQLKTTEDLKHKSEDILATYVPKTDYDMINGKLQEATRNEEKHKDKIVTLQRERDNALNSRSDDLRSLQQQLEMSRGTLEKREQELQAENKKLCDDLNTAHKQNDATSQWLKQKLAQSNAKYEDACAALQRQMEESASHLECVTATYKQKLESENAKLRDVTEQLRVMKRKYDEERSNCLAERREKDDALTRLSAIASARLRDNNPNITDLSDMNRPTKLGEKSAELYDNEWTDAYDALEQNNLNDVEIVKALLEIFTGTFIACKELAGDDYLAQVQAFLEFPGLGRPQELPDNIYMPDQLQQQVKEYRKLRGPGKISEVAEMLKGKIHLPCGNQNDVQKYFKKCVELCWLAVLQDPPLDVDTNVRPGDKFDSSLYRDYTARGPYVEYVVWPAIRLHKNGPLLAKGVAQGCKTDPNKN